MCHALDIAGKVGLRRNYGHGRGGGVYVGIGEVVAVEMCLGYVMVMAWICVPTYVEVDRRPNIDIEKRIFDGRMT